MDSELDCDKMDYLLRDSLFCGVKYGTYDVDRLIASLTITNQDGCPRLAIDSGGIQAFEEFVLARYFMFVQVYFHRTRRFFDLMFTNALKVILPDGAYPQTVSDYLSWDDCRFIQMMKSHITDCEACANIIQRNVYSCVNESVTHPQSGDKIEFKLISLNAKKALGEENFLEDYSAGKMPHKIPMKCELDDEKAVIIIH